MIDILSEKQISNFKIEYFEISDSQAEIEWFQRGIRTFPGKFVRLTQNNKIWMSNTFNEKLLNAEFIRNAFGKVLIAGLGLGYCIVELFKKKEVCNIVVIEKYQEVIDLVVPSLRKYLGKNKNKLYMINADVFDYLKRKPDKKFNCIYFDIWGNYSGVEYPEMKKLHRMARKWRDYSDPRGFTTSWNLKEVRKKYNEV